MREKIDAFIAQWERKSKDSTYLDSMLHKRIREPLIDGLMKIIDAEMLALAGARDPAAENDGTAKKPKGKR